MAKAKKKQKMSAPKKVLIAVAALVALMGVATIPFVTATAEADTFIYIPKGSTMEALSDSLKQNTGEAFASRVTTLLRLSGMNVEARHGAFQIKAGESALKAAYTLRRGEPSELKFTFNNVRTLDEWARRAAAKFQPSKEDFLKALKDPELCKKFDHTPSNIGCILLADSYKFYWDVTPEKLLKNFYNYYQQFWTDERTAKAKAMGLTPDDVVIVASIVEEETAKRDERGKVGRLYINRLQKKMRLQADPTVKFAIGDFSIKRITLKMCAYESPYNTYRVAGLPPGPIRLPEKQTIDAILDSKPHDYIYMCAKSDFSGYHAFAVDLAEHNENARRYQAELNKRNIK
ncbi:MAG: endolytic transglycosylase MltG [Bacteroidales bacterium]|nr:endolytic transglycosylase MltG [Bacteroidales bacterium]